MSILPRYHVPGDIPTPPDRQPAPSTYMTLMYNQHYPLLTTHYHAPTGHWVVHGTDTLLPANYAPPEHNQGLDTYASTYDFTGQNVTLLNKYQKGNFLDSDGLFFGFSARKMGRVLMETFPKPPFTHCFHKSGPPRGGGGALQDFTRCGSNYLHTASLKKYPESKAFDSTGILFGSSAPKIGRVLMKTFSKPSFTHFFQKKTPGGGFLPVSTRCGTNYLHTPLLKKFPKATPWTPRACFFDSAPPK